MRTLPFALINDTSLPWIGLGLLLLISVISISLLWRKQRLLQATIAQKTSKIEALESRIPELHQTVTTLQKNNLELRHSNRSKSKFLSTMSHELRTPLNGILGFADLLKGQHFGPLNEKQSEHVQRIHTSGRHLLELINDLLDLAKIDAGAMELQIETFPIHEVIHSMASLMQIQFRKKVIHLDVQIDSNVTNVRGDIRKVKQVILNLLTNACKYTPPHGHVSLNASLTSEGQIKISVKDDGIGISPDDQKNIFNEFYQIDRVRDESLGGTGIGLALCHRIVALHGGEIDVESALGEGSTFSFTLSAASLKKTNNTSSNRTEAPLPEIPPSRILIAEDNEINLAMLLDLLTPQGHQTIVARNGVEAIELAKQQDLDLILMDIRMPKVDGLHATRQIRKLPQHKETPIIALTASADVKSEQACLQAGCNQHIAKPINGQTLHLALHHLLSPSQPVTSS